MMAWSSGCGDSEAPPGECSLPEEPRFDLTEVTLDVDRSNDQCPTIAASALDTDALAEQGDCEQVVVDCVIELTCDYEGLTIKGRLAEREGKLVGRFDVEQPLICIYAIQAKWQTSTDGGE
jgi:hypothetical protein